MSDFVKAMAAEELAPGKGTELSLVGRPVALFNVEGRFYAISNTCLHRGGPARPGLRGGEHRDLSLARVDVRRHERAERGERRAPGGLLRDEGGRRPGPGEGGLTMRTNKPSIAIAALLAFLGTSATAQEQPPAGSSRRGGGSDRDLPLGDRAGHRGPRRRRQEGQTRHRPPPGRARHHRRREASDDHELREDLPHSRARGKQGGPAARVHEPAAREPHRPLVRGALRRRAPDSLPGSPRQAGGGQLPRARHGRGRPRHPGGRGGRGLVDAPACPRAARSSWGC